MKFKYIKMEREEKYDVSNDTGTVRDVIIIYY